MEITDDKLLKIALITSLVGIIGLIIFTPTIEVKEVELKDINRGMIDEEVKVSCVVQDISQSKSKSSYFLTINDGTAQMPLIIFENSEAFSIVLGSTFRLLIASFAAYLVGSIVNAKLMVYLKKWDEDKLFFRCIVSTLFGEGLDAIVFIFIGFLGTMPLEALLLMIVAQALFKTIYEIIVYPLTRTVIIKIRELPEA